MKRNRDLPKESGYAGLFVIIMLSALFCVIGAAKLFVPGFRMLYVGVLLCVILIAWGIWMIASYFRRQMYRRVGNYDFSAGVLLLIAGVLLLLRVESITKQMPLFLGILCLIQGVVLLQNALQVKMLRGGVWLLLLAFSILTIAASVLVILDPAGWISSYEVVLYGGLLVIGALGWIALILVAFYTSRMRRDENRKEARNLEEEKEHREAEARKRREEAQSEPALSGEFIGKPSGEVPRSDSEGAQTEPAGPACPEGQQEPAAAQADAPAPAAESSEFFETPPTSQTDATADSGQPAAEGSDGQPPAQETTSASVFSEDISGEQTQEESSGQNQAGTQAAPEEMAPDAADV